MDEQNYYVTELMGKKADKLLNQTFSIPALIFGSTYYAYRKLYLEGAILLFLTNFFNYLIIKLCRIIIEEEFILFAICDFVYFCLVSFISAILFPKIYLNRIEKRAKKIENDDKLIGVDKMNQCKKRGGTSILLLIVFLIITGSINAKLFDFDDISYNLINNSGEFFDKNADVKGVSIGKSSTGNIEDYIEVEFSEGYLKKDKYYDFTEKKYLDSIIEFVKLDETCWVKFELASSFSFTSGNKEINTFEDFEKYKVKKINFNGVDWYYLNCLLFEDVHYYITNYKGQTLVIEIAFDQFVQYDKFKVIDIVKKSFQFVGANNTSENKNEKLDISKYLKTDIPKEFKVSKNTKDSCNYKYGDYGEINFQVIDETSEEYFDKIVEENEIEDTRYSAETDYLVWDLLGAEINDELHYYSITEVDDVTIVFEYVVKLDTDYTDELNELYQELILGIEKVD